jgi:tetratricopeptide (TPR) repeat protein
MYMLDCTPSQALARNLTSRSSKPAFWLLFVTSLLLTLPARAQAPSTDWQEQVRKYAQAKDWESAMRIVDREIARAPGDMDVRAWRARVLEWSGNLPQAEKEYLQIVQVSKNDPDNWLGLGEVYLREGKTHEAARVLDIAMGLDPGRADLHMARGRVLAALGDRKNAQLEFQAAVRLDPANEEARLAQKSVLAEPRNELRIGQEDNAFNFTGPNYDEWLSLRTQWSSHWSTTLLGNFFQWGPADAGKFGASVTGRLAKWGALTLGGDAAHDSGVLPKTEAFFELDHGWKLGERGFVRGLEVTYNQHWYWYSTVRVLTFSGVVLVYLPRDWTFSLSEIEARSDFPGLGTQWRPSELARLGFPIVRREERQLSGNVFFATGTEDFASVDQIGSFASETFGGGLRFSLTARQDIGPYVSYQKRSQGRTDTNFGLNYGLRF